MAVLSSGACTRPRCTPFFMMTLGAGGMSGPWARPKSPSKKPLCRVADIGALRTLSELTHTIIRRNDGAGRQPFASGVQRMRVHNRTSEQIKECYRQAKRCRDLAVLVRDDSQ